MHEVRKLRREGLYDPRCEHDACGVGGFTPAGAYSIDTGNGGNDPRAVAAVDLNEDGSLDLAVSDNGNDEVVTLLGNGDGTFQPPVNHGLGAGTGVNALAAGDFNRDGPPIWRRPVAAPTPSPSSGATATAPSRPPRTPARESLGSTPSPRAAGDLDGDGDLDLAVANNNAPGTVTLLRNNGAGTFSAAGSPATADNSRSVALGDFDRDGDQDLGRFVYGVPSFTGGEKGSMCNE